MPTPFEIFQDPIILISLLMYLILMIWEFAFPARKLPKIRWWKLRGIIAMVVYILISVYLPLIYAAYLPGSTLFDASDLITPLQVLIGVFTYELALYTWHRTMHRTDILWRVFHQMHHSAERIDTFGAFYFSPFDMIGFTTMITVCFSLFVGLSPMAITIVLLTSNFLSIFQHTNISTPLWMGYIIQRPEAHALHHGKGVHGSNYCDLPLIDMLFGTYVNPEKFQQDSGFYIGASEKIVSMMLFKDISEENSA